MNMKKLVLFFVVFGVLALSMTFVGAYTYNCPDNQTILRLFSTANSHASTFNSVGYDTRICYNETFGKDYTGTTPHACTSSPSSNLVLNLSWLTNAHAEKANYGNYPFGVCFGDLVCNVRSSCLSGEAEIVSLFGLTNAHIAAYGAGASGYANKVCCSSVSGGIPVINGFCGTTNNACINGALNDIADNSTHYLWRCEGSNGGTSDDCSLLKSGPATNFTIGEVRWTEPNMCVRGYAHLEVYSSVVPSVPGQIAFNIYECDPDSDPPGSHCSAKQQFTSEFPLVSTEVGENNISTSFYISVDDFDLGETGGNDDQIQEYYFEVIGKNGATGRNISGKLYVNGSCEIVTYGGCDYYNYPALPEYGETNCNNDKNILYSRIFSDPTYEANRAKCESDEWNCYCLWDPNPLIVDKNCAYHEVNETGEIDSDGSCTETGGCTKWPSSGICEEGFLRLDTLSRFTSYSCDLSITATSSGCVDSTQQVPCRRAVYELPFFTWAQLIGVLVIIALIYFAMFRKKKGNNDKAVGKKSGKK